MQSGAGMIVPQSGGNQRVSAQQRNNRLKVSQQALARVHKSTHNQALVILKAGQILAPQTGNPGQNRARREPTRADSGASNSFHIHLAAISLKGLNQHRVNRDGRIQGQRALGGVSAQPHWAQQNRGVNRAHRAVAHLLTKLGHTQRQMHRSLTKLALQLVRAGSQGVERTLRHTQRGVFAHQVTQARSAAAVKLRQARGVTVS